MMKKIDLFIHFNRIDECDGWMDRHHMMAQVAHMKMLVHKNA